MEALRARGAFVWKVHGNEYTMAGLPDIVGVYNGKMIAVETKMPGRRGNVSKVQALRHDQIRSAGGVVVVATSVEEALEVLK